jgi:GDP-L-fucose synthase
VDGQGASAVIFKDMQTQLSVGSMHKDARIYVAGHGGLVGSAILRALQARGYSNLIARSRAELDLERQGEVEEFFRREKPEFVVMAAAKVGGIGANAVYPAEFIYRNLAIQTNVIHASWKAGVERLLFLGSSCIYPRDCPQPMREDQLLSGPLESTNESYAIAKIAGAIQCTAYNRQYGTEFLVVMPTNLYGPNDNFDLETSHVLPALIRKFHLAKLACEGQWDHLSRDESKFGPVPADVLSQLCLMAGPLEHGPPEGLISRIHCVDRPSVATDLGGGTLSLRDMALTLWGTGTARREFLHVDDLADACLFLLSLEDERFRRLCAPGGSRPLMNIGCGEDLTIADLAMQVASVVGYSGGIAWDRARPDGPPRKLLDVGRLDSLGWKPRISLGQGIKGTYDWYLRQLG